MGVATPIVTTPFVKATEVWAPAPNTDELQFVSGSYGALDAFRDASTRHRFGYGLGLAGTAWSARRPVLMRTDDVSFERPEAAAAAGITCAIAIPTFAGDLLTGVVVFLCGDEESNVGAIEVWRCDTTRGHDMTLSDGYFGRLDRFEFIARHTSFRRGTGLPGLVWESGAPVLMHELGRSGQFVRSAGAGEAGISTGLGIPAGPDADDRYVIAFLSSSSTPIARVVEIWRRDGDDLVFGEGFHEGGTDLAERHRGVRIRARQGTIGRALFRQMPVVSTFVGPLGEELGCTSLVAIPVLDGGRCTEVVTLAS